MWSTSRSEDRWSTVECPWVSGPKARAIASGCETARATTSHTAWRGDPSAFAVWTSLRNESTENFMAPALRVRSGLPTSCTTAESPASRGPARVLRPAG